LLLPPYAFKWGMGKSEVIKGILVLVVNL